MSYTTEELKLIEKALVSFAKEPEARTKTPELLNVLTKVKLDIQDNEFEEQKLPHERIS